MTRRHDDVVAWLDARRGEGADRLDPVGFARIEALARRANAQHGAVRSLLDARLVALVDAYDREPAPAVHAPNGCGRTARRSTALAALGQAIGNAAARRRAVSAAPVQPVERTTLDDVRRLCVRVRADSQLRLAMADAPVDAGPLNSTHLVHRAIGHLGEIAPGYLHALIGYVDILARLEASAAAKTPATAAGGKRARPRRARNSRR